MWLARPAPTGPAAATRAAGLGRVDAVALDGHQAEHRTARTPTGEQPLGPHPDRDGPGRPPFLGASPQVLGGSRFGPGEGEQHAQCQQGGQQRRTAERHQGQGHSGDRQQADDGAHVHHRLYDDPRGDAGGGEPDEQVVAAVRDAQPRVAEHPEQAHHHQAADQPQLLPDDRQDEVGVHRRQKVGPLLHGRAEPLTPPATCRERVDALDGLEAVPVGVREGIGERQQAAHPIGLQHRQHRRGDDDRHEHRGVEALRGADHPQDGQRHDGHADRTAEIRLEQNQQVDEQEHRHQGHQQVLGLREPAALAHQQIGAPQHQRDLHQLAGLHRDRTDHDPLPGTAADTADPRDEHHQQQEDREAEQRVGHPPEDPHRQAAGQHGDRHTDAHPDRLPDEQRVGRAGVRVRPYAGRREHHDQAEQQQQTDRGQQQVVGRQRPVQQRHPRRRLPVLLAFPAYPACLARLARHRDRPRPHRNLVTWQPATPRRPGTPL